MRLPFSPLKVLSVVRGYKKFKSLIEGLKECNYDKIYEALRHLMSGAEEDKVRTVANILYTIASSQSEGEVYAKVREELARLGVDTSSIDDVVEFIQDVVEMFKGEAKKLAKLLETEHEHKAAAEESQSEDNEENVEDIKNMRNVTFFMDGKFR